MYERVTGKPTPGRIAARARKLLNKARTLSHAPSSLEMLQILDRNLGHFQSRKTLTPVNRDGDPIPWYTYPAIEYLEQLDFRDKVVFEWGSGNSSLYWARAAKHVTSIESDPDWFERGEGNKRENQVLHLIRDEQEYVGSIADSGREYDVIIIDGLYRYPCSLVAPEHLASGGLIILDNSDWWPKSAGVLRDADLIQVDMSGFGPVNKYTWATSLFFDRNFRFNSKGERQPGYGAGALIQTADER